MISTNKKKSNFAKFLFALVFLVFASSDFSDYYFLTEQYKSEKNSIAEEQFSYIREALEDYQKEAIENAENTKIDVVKGLEIAYNSDMEQLKKDIDNLLITSTFPFIHAVSIACLIALSTRDAVVLYIFAISGYNLFVTLSNIVESLYARVIAVLM